MVVIIFIRLRLVEHLPLLGTRTMHILIVAGGGGGGAGRGGGGGAGGVIYEISTKIEWRNI